MTDQDKIIEAMTEARDEAVCKGEKYDELFTVAILAEWRERLRQGPSEAALERVADAIAETDAMRAEVWETLFSRRTRRAAAAIRAYHEEIIRELEEGK